MGAGNRKPQTVQMSNTSVFQISPDVLERVENATNPKKSAADVSTPAPATCENCSPIDVQHAPCKMQSCEQQQMAIAATWSRRSTEMEESQFSKMMDHVHSLFGQPVKWTVANECTADIGLMEQQLIACYRQCGNESLNCAQLAKQYHTFVFSKQANAAVNIKSVDSRDKAHTESP